jgi:N-formylglutamate amidohydrolase
MVDAVMASYGKPAVGPVVMTVSHAGRDYTTDILSQLVVPLHMARALEDRHADVLAAKAIESGRHVLVAKVPRLVIDLNRSETDFSPAMVVGPPTLAAMPSARARGGLGLVPDRLANVGRLWKSPLAATALVDRLRTYHRPFHAAVANALEQARALHGWALLIDLHSMPTLEGVSPPDLVIGTRYGSTAPGSFVDAIRGIASAHGFKTALDAPYAGGHIVTRHARPLQNIFAVQLEFDRRLYLDSAGDAPGPGAERLARAVEEMCEACAAAGPQDMLQLAAE